MAEIRLICPACTVEYRVPDTAIPAEGREVECSACGNVWHATARPARRDPTDFQARIPSEPPAGMPPLNRRLPDSVLGILRDEVEHERRARASEEAPPRAGPRPAPEAEWPATTITRHSDPRPVEAAASSPGVGLAPVLPAAPKPAASEPAAPVEPVRREEAAPPAAVPVPVRRPSRGGYGAGFGLSAILAAACVALYLLAPSLADHGGFGDGLMQIRGQVDEARLWLQHRAAALTR